jgi:UDP-N-acetylglucosamine enolpyruvyl transferase
MEDAFVITGGKKLIGEVTLSGAKNVSLKVIIAS